jgi:GNAT superfamily N-acetyltransferase
MTIETVTEGDLPDLLPLMRGYSDFYRSDPSDEALLAMSRALIANPEYEGVQLIARDDGGPPTAPATALGFATIFWTWSTNSAARIGVMNDLFVAEQGRGRGIADALIKACVDRCRERGAVRLEWQTALDNHRAQAVYERVGGHREQWFDYSLPASP